MIRISKRFQEAAQRILDGDESKIAAAALEGVLLDEYLGEEDMENLLFALSLYAPGDGPEYFDGPQLRRTLQETLSNVHFPRPKEQP
ncbi:hypothetical protein ACJJV6_17610 [Arthrobacter nitrophenolicus]|uniref:Uncharacterized protein n=1 Tax=Arthrobacter nitrophenolicus TaxID=683150 RepID=A0ACC6TIH0_9MICC